MSPGSAGTAGSGHRVQPPEPTDHDAIAEQAWGVLVAARPDRSDDLNVVAHAIAQNLLPVVDRIAKERAADELRAVAHRLDDGGDEAIEVALGGAAYVHRVLCDCAHALDGKP